MHTKRSSIIRQNEHRIFLNLAHNGGVGGISKIVLHLTQMYATLKNTHPSHAKVQKKPFINFTSSLHDQNWNYRKFVADIYPWMDWPIKAQKEDNYTIYTLIIPLNYLYFITYPQRWLVNSKLRRSNLVEQDCVRFWVLKIISAFK